MTIAVRLRTRAGVPATTAFGGTLRVTTLPAPTMAFSPTVRLARMVAPEPMEAPRRMRVEATFIRRGASIGTTPDEGGGDLPIVLGLEGSVRRSSRVEVVDEGDAVADEDVVFNGDAFADEGVAGDFAIAADLG